MTSNPWEIRGKVVAGDGRPRVMGIINVTPDSFSDGGLTPTAEEAAAYALRLVNDGVDLLDIGGESTRPGAEPVSIEEELERVVPTVEALAEVIDVPISVDTSKPAVARAALAAGAAIINDVTALRGDPEMARAVAEAHAGVVLMHMRGTPRTMQENPTYQDVVREVYDELARRVEDAESWGIPRSRIAIDPGIGFGKTVDHNLDLLRHLGRFANLGCCVLVGTSRKSFLGKITGRDVTERLVASVTSALAALVSGADVVRVHDGIETLDAIKVWSAQCGWERPMNPMRS